MFCILCNKHGAQNELNKSKTYSSKKVMRFHKLAQEEHVASKQDHAAITGEMFPQVSHFHQEYGNQVNSRDKV